MFLETESQFKNGYIQLSDSDLIKYNKLSAVSKMLQLAYFIFNSKSMDYFKQTILKMYVLKNVKEYVMFEEVFTRLFQSKDVYSSFGLSNFEGKEKIISPEFIDMFNKAKDEYNKQQGYEQTLFSRSIANTDSEGKKLSVMQKLHFANSQVVNKQGQLIRVYHGTENAGFTVFGKDKPKHSISRIPFLKLRLQAEGYDVSNFNPFFFVEDEKIAKSYLTLNSNGITYTGKTPNKFNPYDSKSNGAIYSGYLNLQNPLVIDAQIIDATFRNRWSGVFLQMNGFKNVIVTVGWVSPKSYDICFSGIQDGTVLMISTLGVNNDNCKFLFLEGYKELRNRFPKSKVICVGDKLKEMDNDVIFVRYENSFGYKNLDYWQPSLMDYEIIDKEVS